MKHFIMGTAGHKGHGKTALIHALTGTRSPQGTGDARMRFDETLLEIVDLQGEDGDFQTMLAAIADVDMVLLAVAGDVGITEQTLLHLQIISLFDISRCIVALTKTDQLDELQLDAARRAVLGLYEQGLPRCTPVVEVSSCNGNGVERLVETIVEQCALMPVHRCERPFYMHINRTDTQSGRFFVAGCVREGGVCVGDEVMLCPNGEVTQVLAVQEADGTPLACAGQRVMLELRPPSSPENGQGSALSAVLPNPAAKIIDVRFTLLQDCPQALASGMEVLLYVGTTSAICRISLSKDEPLFPGGRGYGQLVPLTPFSALAGEHFVLCLPSSGCLAGGGLILDAQAPLLGDETNWYKVAMRMSCYEHGGRDGQLHWEAGAAPCTETTLREMFIRWSEEEFCRYRDSLIVRGLLIRAGELLLSAQLAGALKGELIARLTRYHAQNPLGIGIPMTQAYEICPEGLLELCMHDGTVRATQGCLSLPLFYPSKTKRFLQMEAVLMDLFGQRGPMPLEKLIYLSGLPVQEAEMIARYLEKEGKLCIPLCASEEEMQNPEAPQDDRK